jgi:hypothetical protein
MRGAVLAAAFSGGVLLFSAQAVWSLPVVQDMTELAVETNATVPTSVAAGVASPGPGVRRQGWPVGTAAQLEDCRTARNPTSGPTDHLSVVLGDHVGVNQDLTDASGDACHTYASRGRLGALVDRP